MVDRMTEKYIGPAGLSHHRLLGDAMARVVDNETEGHLYIPPKPNVGNTQTKKKSPTLENSKDADYYLDSINIKLEDIHNAFIDIDKQLTVLKEQQAKILRLVQRPRT
jgi:hypothetical protein